jgi:hypothetical protein
MKSDEPEWYVWCCTLMRVVNIAMVWLIFASLALLAVSR